MTEQAKAAHARGIRKAQVGFFSGPTYPDGKRVVQIAFYQNYGTPNARFPVPARPFMNNAIDDVRPQWVAMLRAGLNPRTMAVQRGLAVRLCELVKNQIQLEITTFRDPPNTAFTIAKKGSNNPLVDKRKMLQSVDYQVPAR